jgi:cytosine/adenosine deaminase-related metal-dependent hydrolase
MSSILIKNPDVLTLNESGDVLRRTNIVIAQGRIRSIGAIPADFHADETIEAADHVVMPGFFNAAVRPLAQ